MEKLIEVFLDCLIVERGRSMNTEGTYRIALMQLQQEVGEEFTTDNLQNGIRKFFRTRVGRLSGKTLDNRKTAFKEFFRWGLRRDKLNEGIYQAGINTLDDFHFKIIKKEIKPLSVPSIFKWMLKPSKHTIKGLQDRAAIAIMYGCGIRITAVANLKKSDVNFVDMEIHVACGKGNKERYKPMPDYTAAILHDYIRLLNLAKIYSDAQWLFPNAKATNRMHPHTMRRRVQKQAMEAGLGHLRPHVLKHSCITHLLAEGLPPHMAQWFGDHAHLQTTMGYSHIDKDMAKQAIKELHPLSRQVEQTRLLDIEQYAKNWRDKAGNNII